jgi:MFS transporter, DHA2 family, multidrug resistance protein
MAMAVYGMGVVVAPVVGPTLGGWITDNYTWRWIFLINIPVGILSLALTSLLIFDPPYLKRRSLGDGFKIDYAGFGLLALGLGALEVMLDEGQKEDWFASPFIVTFTVIAACCLIGLVLWELRQKEPIIDFRILKERNYALATFSMLVVGVVLYASTALVPMFLQSLLGYTAMMSGLVLSPGGLVMVVMMPVVGMLMRKYQPRWLVIFGALVTSLALYRMARFNLQIDFGTAVWSRMFQSLGLAFLFVPITTTAFANIPRERTSYATGLFNLARNIGGSSGIAAATTLLARRAQLHQSALVAHLTPYDFRYREALNGAAAALRTAGSPSADAALQAQGIVYGNMLRQSNMLAFGDAFWLMATLFLVVVPLMFFLRNVRPRSGQVVVE